MPSVRIVATNCKVYFDNVEQELNTYINITKNQSYNIKFTADSDCVFNIAPSSSSGITLTITANATNTEYTGTMVCTSSYQQTLTANATVNYYTFNIENLSNCTTNILPTTHYNQGDTVTATVTADTGYYFSDAPRISYVRLGNTQYIQMTSSDVGDYKTTYAATFTVPKADGNILYINGVGQVMPSVESDLLGIITIYNPTKQNLLDISTVRYMNNIDLGEYISNMIKVFCVIPEVATANVLLGGYDTGVSCNSLNYEIVETDCGSVTLSLKHYNNLDYESTKVNIYLPLIGFKSLNVTDVIGHVVHVVYKTNLVNGDTLACVFITVDNVDILVDTFSCNGSYTIPYRLNADTKIQGSFDVESNYLYGFTPFIDVSTVKPHDDDNNFSGSDRQLIAYTSFNSNDFISGELIVTNLKCLESEMLILKNLFDKGVIV